MAVTLKGRDAMTPLLAAAGRILIVNRTAPEDRLWIVAAAAVRHRSDGTSQSDVSFGLQVGADESVGLEAIPAEEAVPDAVEVLLRLEIGDAGVVDAYAVAWRSTSDPDMPYELGVKRHDGVLVDGESLVSGFTDFAVYGLPTGA
jgi:hypothetical protein